MSGLEGIRHQVLHALHRMGKLNNIIQDTHGNLSMRDGQDVMYIKPSGMSYEFIGLDDVCKVSLDRPKDDENKRSPSVDTVHHRKIYKKHPWVRSICHTHSPYVVAYAALGRPLWCYTTEQADYFGGKVKCRAYADLDSWGDIELEESEYAVLLECHGALTFGDSAEQTVSRAAALENIARKNYIIETLHKSLGMSPAMNIVGLCRIGQDEVDKWHTRYGDVYGQRDDTDSE